MISVEQASTAATTLRRRLAPLPVVQRVDIGVGFDTSHFVRVWVTHRTREVLAHVPSEVDGVQVRISVE